MSAPWASFTAAERDALGRLLGVSAGVGVCMAGVVIVSNLLLQCDSVALRVLGGLVNLGLVIGLGVLNQRFLPRYMGRVLDRLAERRVRLADRLRATDLRSHERNPERAGAISAELDVLDDLPWMLGTLGFMSATIALSTLFIGALSRAGLVVWLGVIAAIVLYQRRARAAMAEGAPLLAQARRRFGAALRLRLQGHAQLQHDRVARAENLESLLELERAAAGAQDRINRTQGKSLAWAEDVLLVGLGLVLFRLPELAGLDAATQYQLTTTLLSVSGMTLVMVGLLLQGRMILGAVERLSEIERGLAPPLGPPPVRPPLPAGPELVLEVDRLTYAYEDGGFHVGPVDLRARGGELVIIRGGNGSGKTTLMRALAGLYPQRGGTLRLGGQRIGPEDLAWYRAHVTAIFVDQHLFDAPYGLDASPGEVRALLERFGLQDTVDLRDGRFTRTALSSGQRKRLAMVVALLERRPILILDEWDSHQDPGLRTFYYETLLPELRAQGRIVLAVSHDERRFALADRLLHLEGGGLVSD